ncbi:MAG: hypothetical protein ABIC04_06465 [Nanoarchaeota archaeon]
MKKILLSLLVLIILAQTTISTKTINVTETELVNLVPQGMDPDNDALTYTYSEPLNEAGKWQTEYGDTGTYTVKITASDGELSTTTQISLIVEKKEEPPLITSFYPKEDVGLEEGSTIKFNISATDINGDSLDYTWYIDDKEAATGTDFSYAPTYFESGTHNVKVIATDRVFKAEKEWKINVIDVDRTKLLDVFKDIEIFETEKVQLELPDFKKYQLDYSISPPIGNDGMLDTDYNSSGVHTITVKIKDGEFEAEKKIVLNIKNVDRPAVFVPIKNVKIRENQKVELKLKAIDPDSDEISYTAINLPKDAKFEDNTLIWETNYDTVTKEGIIDIILDKFHLLSKNFAITLSAVSNEIETKQDFKITVFDVNRAPVMDEVADITVDEGEIIKITATATDPDNDNIKFKCSGWIDNCEYQTSYADEGMYIVKVTATDGFLSDNQDITVTVKDVNQKPNLIFENQIIEEGKRLQVKIDAIDPDGDEVKINIQNMPDNASFENNILDFTPHYGITNAKSVNISITVEADDGYSNITRDLIITVLNTNLAPEIKQTIPMKEFTTYTGSQIQFEVVAEDFDNDALTYTWKFGLFEEYNATAIHLRKFTTPGKKKVEVSVSDGEEIKSYFWNVNIVNKAIPKKVVKEQEPQQTVQPKESQQTAQPEKSQQATQPEEPVKVYKRYVV